MDNLIRGRNTPRVLCLMVLMIVLCMIGYQQVVVSQKSDVAQYKLISTLDENTIESSLKRLRIVFKEFVEDYSDELHRVFKNFKELELASKKEMETNEEIREKNLKTIEANLVVMFMRTKEEVIDSIGKVNKILKPKTSEGQKIEEKSTKDEESQKGSPKTEENKSSNEGKDKQTNEENPNEDNKEKKGTQSKGKGSDKTKEKEQKEQEQKNNKGQEQKEQEQKKKEEKEQKKQEQKEQEQKKKEQKKKEEKEKAKERKEEEQKEKIRREQEEKEREQEDKIRREQEEKEQEVLFNQKKEQKNSELDKIYEDDISDFDVASENGTSLVAYAGIFVVALIVFSFIGYMYFKSRKNSNPTNGKGTQPYEKVPNKGEEIGFDNLGKGKHGSSYTNEPIDIEV